MIIVWLKLALLIGVIVFTGSKLSRYGDILGEKLGLSGSWIGVVLLAGVTSLPEMFSGISASALVRQPDLAIGNIYGACVMNLVVVGIISTLHTQGQISARVGREQALSAALGMMAIAFSGLGLFISGQNIIPVSLFDVGLFSLAIFILYLAAQHMIYRHEVENPGPEKEPEYQHISMRQAVTKFLAAAAVIVAAGMYLPQVADELARTMGWGRSFVASIFMSLATTSPEMVVSISALRMGRAGMALGNLFGSCIFNVSLIFVDDVFYKGSILTDVSQTHIFTAFLVLAMMGVSLTGLLFPRKKKGLGIMGWDAAVIFGLYLLGIFVIYRMGLTLG
jgi:cation:H+ antiporter